MQLQTLSQQAIFWCTLVVFSWKLFGIMTDHFLNFYFASGNVQGLKKEELFLHEVGGNIGKAVNSA